MLDMTNFEYTDLLQSLKCEILEVHTYSTPWIQRIKSTVSLVAVARL